MVSSKTILGSSIIITSFIVISVHYLQKYEKDIMQQGVVRDVIRLNQKKLNNKDNNQDNNNNNNS